MSGAPRAKGTNMKRLLRLVGDLFILYSFLHFGQTHIWNAH